jgi:tetratricopeptide (TPR) repeat protein
VSAASTAPYCFVAMPFGTKDDAALGKVHFDAVYDDLLRPAVEAVGMHCIRADEEQVGGIIHRPMFERLLLCEYALVDLSLANANVYYELGIRHATRPWSTVLVFQEGFRLPFDVGPLRALPYHLGRDGKPAREHVVADRAALTEKLQHALEQSTDSPVFELTTLEPPDTRTVGGAELFRERIETTAALKERLAAAGRASDLTELRAVQADLGSLGGIDTGLAIDLLKAYLDVSAYDDVVAVVSAMPAVVRRTPFVRERLAFALNRLGEPTKAEEVLLRLIDERGKNSETYGLLGRVYKDQWNDAVIAGRRARAAGLLDKAITAYLDGFEADWRDHYPGINAVQLMHLRDPDDPLIGELLPVVRYSARLKARRQQADYWDHATLLEVAVLENDPDAAWTALAMALATDPRDWQARSTLDTLVRLRHARERTRPVPGWVHQIETELADVAGPDAS